MNPEAPEIKRGPGRPRKEAPQAVYKITESGVNEIERLETHPTQSLGDLYAAIDAAPAEWLPSLLVKIVRVSLKAKVWSNVENLILSVRGCAK